jgi:hypothetical protein
MMRPYPLRRLIPFILVVLVLAACSDSAGDVAETTLAPPTTEAATTTTEPATTTTEPATTSSFDAEALATGWDFEPLNLPFPPDVDLFHETQDAVRGLAASPLGMVTFGQVDSVNEVFRTPIVWFSSDGDSWEQVGEDVLVTALITDVVAGGPGFVMVGSDCSVPDIDVCEADPAVWTSVDGRSWERVAHDPDVFPGCSGQGDLEVNPQLEGNLAGCVGGHYRPTVNRVSVSDQGIMAIGSDPTWTLLWLSEDGLAWSRIDRSAAPTYQQVGDFGWTIYMDEPGAWTSIGLVQPGMRCTDRYEGDELLTDCWGLIWFSTNGVAWIAEEPDEEWLAEWWPLVAVNDENGVVVFGNRSPTCNWCPWDFDLEPTTIVAGHSPDGSEWTEVTLPSADVGRIWSGSVISTPLGMIALAEEDPERTGVDEPRLAGMWHSDDGRSWTRVSELQNQPQDLWVKSLGWDGSQLILLGSALREEERTLLLGKWSSP